MSNYGIKDIQTLEGLEALRKRPGMYIGSVDRQGVNHIVQEIISNSVDEYLEGHCDRIRVTLNTKENTICVEDNGRGMPGGFREDGENVLESLFTKLHTGAKFSQDGSSGYNSSGGLHGIGTKAANALSTELTVYSHRDGKEYFARFERGETKEYKETAYKGDTGTAITFSPDALIFKEDNTVDPKWLRENLKETSFLCAGLTLELSIDDKKETYKAENGLNDYLDSIINDKEIIKNRMHFTVARNDMKAEIALTYVNKSSDTLKLYTNNIYNSEGGTHLTGFRTAFTTAINKYAKETGLLGDNANLTGSELSEGQVLIMSFRMPEPVFSGQTKAKLSSAEGRSFLSQESKDFIEDYLISNPKEAASIIEQALKGRKAKEAAKKVREVTVAPARKKTGIKAKELISEKLTDCSSKNREECEIFLVEGKR